MKKKSKNKKIMITIILLIVICSVAIFSIKNKNLNSNNKNIIGETDITKKNYGYPLIKLLSESNDIVTIDAGIYRYGDINLDGIVGEKDIDKLHMIIDTNIAFTNGQLKIADVNEDGTINNSDIDLFNKYLDNNGEVKYDIGSNLLSYCLIDTNDSSKCNWQPNSSFTIKEAKDYYAFVKQDSNGRISEVMKINKETFDRSKEI